MPFPTSNLTSAIPLCHGCDSMHGQPIGIFRCWLVVQYQYKKVGTTDFMDKCCIVLATVRTMPICRDWHPTRAGTIAMEPHIGGNTKQTTNDLFECLMRQCMCSSIARLWNREFPMTLPWALARQIEVVKAPPQGFSHVWTSGLVVFVGLAECLGGYSLEHFWPSSQGCLWMFQVRNCLAITSSITHDVAIPLRNCKSLWHLMDVKLGIPFFKLMLTSRSLPLPLGGGIF